MLINVLKQNGSSHSEVLLEKVFLKNRQKFLKSICDEVRSATLLKMNSFSGTLLLQL